MSLRRDPNTDHAMKSLILITALTIGAALPCHAVSTPEATVQTDDAEARARLDELVERLNARTEYDIPLSEELELHLATYPGLIGEVPALLRSGAASLDTSRTMIFALECIGAPDAQEALVQIQGDAGQRQMDRVRAVISLGALASPSELSLSTLWATSTNRLDGESMALSNAALLGLGISGNQLRHDGSETYANVRDGLLERVHSAGDAPLRVITLKAIGNLHDPTLAEDASLYLFDEQPTVRATAAQALAMLRADSKRSLLADLLPEEPRGIVRAAFVEALRGLAPDAGSLSAVHALVRAERNTEARAQMVEYLVENLEQHPQARATLIEMTSKDPANRIRILASAALRH